MAQYKDNILNVPEQDDVFTYNSSGPRGNTDFGEAILSIPGGRHVARSGTRLAEEVGSFGGFGDLGRYLAEQQVPYQLLQQTGKVPTQEDIQQVREAFPEARKQEPTRQNIQQGAADIFGKEAITPQGSIERIADETLQTIPYLFSGNGINFFNRLGYSALGKAGKELASGLNSGPIGELIGEIGVPLLFDIARGGVSFQNKLTEQAQPLYEKAKYYGQTTKRSNDLSKRMQGFLKDYSRDTKVSDSVRDAASKVIRDIENGQMPLNSAVEAKKYISEKLRGGEYPRTAEKVIKRIVKDVDNWIKDKGSEVPDFAKNYFPAQGISTFKNAITNTQDVFKDIFSKGKLNRIISLLPEGIKSGANALRGVPVTRQGIKINKAAGNLVKDMFANNKVSATAKANQLLKLLENQNKTEPSNGYKVSYLD